MKIRFYIKYSTKWGESLYILPFTGSDKTSPPGDPVPMQYLDENHWTGELERKRSANILHYQYFVKFEAGGTLSSGTYSISLGKRSLTVIDAWTDAQGLLSFFEQDVFQKVLLRPNKTAAAKITENYTHEFRVKWPLLQPQEALCILGSTPTFGRWQTDAPIVMQRQGDSCVAKIKLGETDRPLAYKYGIFHTGSGRFLRFEEGENRRLLDKGSTQDQCLVHDGYARFGEVFQGCGVAIPLFSLRSRDGFGTGEFEDLTLFIDWAGKTGLRLIQLLPVNDTIATGGWEDSYPYGAISAFALHPLYLRLEKVAGKNGHDSITRLASERKKLNARDFVDYPQVISLKIKALKEIFKSQKENLKADSGFTDFCEQNKKWLFPYAAFCMLRDKHKTVDFSKWKNYADYREDEIEALIRKNRRNEDAITFYSFLQYHAHRQMSDVAAYARRKGIVLKGDLPIGVSRQSCDAWVNRDLFHMDQQAGAPPDDFAVTGQNWGFPTYNWERMSYNDFQWWKSRLSQMSQYFDAYRIDHILGFFRIWSIPIEQTEGIMGRFVPAIPVTRDEFVQQQIDFEEERFCKPYITAQTLHEIFGDAKKKIMSKYLVLQGTRYALKEKFDTQAKIEKNVREGESVKKGLKELCANVLLFEEPDSNGQRFHFRFGIAHTNAIKDLDYDTKQKLFGLYNDYYYNRQNRLWKEKGRERLQPLLQSTPMLVFGEDLGLVPPVVPELMREMKILSLEVERMPKSSDREFFHPADAPYLSVVTPSTHDMSTIRQWWQEDPDKTRRFYNNMLGNYGEPPEHCTPDIALQIINQHIYSPAMWSIFLLQDLLAMSARERRKDPAQERINDPANRYNHWKFRMQDNLENLLKDQDFNSRLKNMLEKARRSAL